MRDFMRKVKKISKWAWIYQHRLAIFMVLFFVVLPVIFIPSMYLQKYLDSKPVLFDDKQAEVVSLDDMPVFAIEYTITQVRLPNDENLGGYYKFEYKLTRETGINPINNIRIQFQLVTRWAKYSELSTEQSVTLNQNRSVQMNFNYDMETSVLPFVQASGPYLYAKITYEETIMGEAYPRTIYVRLPYDLIKDNTQIIPA
jgi:hypothetical protein